MYYKTNTDKKLMGNTPLLRRPCIELDKNELPNSIKTDESNIAYSEYIYIGMCKQDNCLKQGCIIRSADEDQSFETTLKCNEDIVKELPKYFCYGSWYKIKQQFEFIKIKNV